MFWGGIFILQSDCKHHEFWKKRVIFHKKNYSLSSSIFLFFSSLYAFRLGWNQVTCLFFMWMCVRFWKSRKSFWFNFSLFLELYLIFLSDFHESIKWKKNKLILLDFFFFRKSNLSHMTYQNVFVLRGIFSNPLAIWFVCLLTQKKINFEILNNIREGLTFCSIWLNA